MFFSRSIYERPLNSAPRRAAFLLDLARNNYNNCSFRRIEYAGRSFRQNSYPSEREGRRGAFGSPPARSISESLDVAWQYSNVPLKRPVPVASNLTGARVHVLY